jgi:hypothetical protein
MAFYAIGTLSDKCQTALIRLCRAHSKEGVSTLAKRFGTGAVLVEWNSSTTAMNHEKASIVASIEAAVASFETLGVPLVYFYRVGKEAEWEKVESHVFRNLLRSDLRTWHEGKLT